MTTMKVKKKMHNKIKFVEIIDLFVSISQYHRNEGLPQDQIDIFNDLSKIK
jgi:hypothetical protein